jgi:hypothetical protein
LPLPKGNAQQTAEYISAIPKLPQILVDRTSHLPPWIDKFRIASEMKAAEAIDALRQEIAEHEKRIVEQQTILSKARELKALFAGTGDEFKDAVALALTELGLKCVDGPHPRADLLATNGSRLMAIEAKGLEGNARESNFRQVERWKAEVNSAVSMSPEELDADPDLRRYSEQLKQFKLPPTIGDDCKGLMVIGTFRNTPVSGRQGPDFPDGVIRMLGHSDVCALTGLQLFGLIILVRKNPEMKSEIADHLFTTAGVLAACRT